MCRFLQLTMLPITTLMTHVSNPTYPSHLFDMKFDHPGPIACVRSCLLLAIYGKPPVDMVFTPRVTFAFPAPRSLIRVFYIVWGGIVNDFGNIFA
jgi:hypothetical protein